jgi:hypothetical protein
LNCISLPELSALAQPVEVCLYVTECPAEMLFQPIDAAYTLKDSEAEWQHDILVFAHSDILTYRFCSLTDSLRIQTPEAGRVWL